MYEVNGRARVVVVGDIHLNLSKNSEWEYNRFMLLSEEIKKAFNEFDGKHILILNGDIFDKARPTYEEIGVFYEFIETFGVDEIFIVAGNHEEISSKITVFDYLPQVNYSYIKMMPIQINDAARLHCFGHPYINGIVYNGLLAEGMYNVLVSHYRSDIGVAEEEVDNQKVSNVYDLAILSDIHYRLQPAQNIFYTSSPYTITYQTDITQNGFVILDIDDDVKMEWKQLYLPCKVKLVYSDEKDLNVINEFLLANISSEHLYKIVFEFSNDERVKELVSKFPNIKSVVFTQEDYDSEDFSEIVDELQSTNNENLVDTLHTLIKKTGSVSEEALEIGYSELRGIIND